ncbi:uncharacterized protein LOC142347974 [Convolutriloba macropyga]|uniref:uncharacterized protein LOC142347974 n=1 Tax=Convolutriloba macropyga TaxID=536237 RepID=UPI003F51D313
MDLKKYKLDVLGVQETRLEEQEIDLGDHKLFLTDSWLSTAKARQGRVGIAVTKRLAGSLIEQVAVSERMAYVNFKQRERVCLVGDFNAEPGQQSDVNMPCRGPFGMGEENDNSEKLLSFCASHDLLIGGTWFRHRPKYTALGLPEVAGISRNEGNPV